MGAVNSRSSATQEQSEAAKERWNAEADQYNQWRALGQDEKDELIAGELHRNKSPVGRNDKTC